MYTKKQDYQIKKHSVVITTNSTATNILDAVDLVLGSSIIPYQDSLPIRKMVLQNPSNSTQYYSLSDNTLIHLPDNSHKNMILHGIEQGKEIQLNVPFTKHNYFNDTPIANVSGKVFTHDIGEINTLNIKEIRDNSSEPIFTWYNTNMTSDTAPSPLVASASSSYSADYLPFRAFDGSIELLPNGANSTWLTANNVTTGWIQIDFGTNKKVNIFKIYPRQNELANAGISATPKRFTLMGSNDGSNFNKIKEFENIVWNNLREKQFVLDSEVNYRFYKIDVMENNGSMLYVAIGELLFGYKREVN